MDHNTITIVLFLILTIHLVHKLVKKTLISKSRSLPPGPKQWPIIGNIHQLGDKPHQSVANLAKLHGPIMTLKLGTVTTIVISSPDISKEMFLKHDLTLSSRKSPDAFTNTNHEIFSMVYMPVCPKWRSLRKIIAIQAFSNKRLDSSNMVVLREKKVIELIEHARHCYSNDVHVDIGKAGFTTVLNLLSNTFFSMDLASHESSYLQEFKCLVWDLLEEGGRPNVSDFFPMVSYFDLQGVRKRYKVLFRKMLGIFEKIIDERLKGELGVNDDVLDSLLMSVKDEEITVDDVKHLLLDLFIAGTDTTSSTLEWAMTELLRNPEKMIIAQNELDKVISKDNGTVKESDISNLPYIQAVVKETFRLHPPTPLLVPHVAEKDVDDLCDYFVPKNAKIWVNLWSIGRDPSVWPNPQSYSPERFMESEIDVKGRDFELIPFGAGRRICPGMPLGNRMLHLMLVNLLYSYTWKHAHGLNAQDIDVHEKFGIALQKLHPLHAIPLVR